MTTLLENLAEFVKMIFGVLVTPNYAAQDESLNIMRYIFYPIASDTQIVRYVVLLSFGIALAGVSIGILKRLLWKS